MISYYQMSLTEALNYKDQEIESLIEESKLDHEHILRLECELENFKEMFSMKQPKYIIYDTNVGDYYMSFGDDYTDFIDEAHKYTNAEIINHFERCPSWLPTGVKLIQTYED